jgi:hypothetical protein
VAKTKDSDGIPYHHLFAEKNLFKDSFRTATIIISLNTNSGVPLFFHILYNKREIHI